MRGAHLLIQGLPYFYGDYHITPVPLIRERGKPANLPGGKCEEGESFINTIKRELVEELGNVGVFLADCIDERTQYVDSFADDVHSRIYFLWFRGVPEDLNIFHKEFDVYDLYKLNDARYLNNNNIAPYTKRHINDSLKEFEDINGSFIIFPHQHMEGFLFNRTSHTDNQLAELRGMKILNNEYNVEMDDLSNK